MQNCCRNFLLIGLAIVASPMAAHGENVQAQYSPPELVADAPRRLATIETELDNRTDTAVVADAADRFDSLFREAGTSLMPAADGTPIAVGHWLTQLSADRRTTLATALEKLVGSTAQQALSDLRSHAFVDPIEYIALAHRYPLTSTANEALIAAAKQSELLGDLQTRDAMLALAASKMPITPVEPGQAVPFRAPWMSSLGRSGWAAMRSFPTQVAGTTLIVGPTQVVAIGANDQVLWRGPVGPQPPAGQGASDPTGVTRGPALSAAVFAPDGQSPAIVVVRQPQVHGDGWAIRALRGSDGSLLWTTEDREDVGRLVFASNATVAGRYVYVVAGDPAPQVDQLYLVALELTTGRQLWRCTLGSVSHPSVVRWAMAIRGQVTSTEEYRPWLNQSAPVLTGDSVLLAPDVGMIASVDRFDGTLKWVRPYGSLPMPLPDRHRSAVEAAMAAQAAARHHRHGDPPMNPSMRWNNRVIVSGGASQEHALFVAPQDSDAVMAVSVDDGHVLWQSNQIAVPNARKLDDPYVSLADYSLVGVLGDSIILQGQSLIGLAINDGHATGRTDDLVNFTGPAMMIGDHLIVPTRDKGWQEMTDLSSAHEGSAVTIDKSLKSDAVRRAMQASDVLDCFTAVSGGK